MAESDDNTLHGAFRMLAGVQAYLIATSFAQDNWPQAVQEAARLTMSVMEEYGAHKGTIH